jgi:predicted Zn-dependent peptidase
MPALLPPVRGLLALLCAAALSAQSPQAPEVVERRLNNGVRVLAIERPGSGMVRAALVFRGGTADVPGLPPASAQLLAGALFGELRPEDLGEQKDLDLLLDWAGHLREGLRVERLRQARTGGTAGEEAPLAASLQELESRIAAKCASGGGPDLLDALGAVNREIHAEADGILVAQDLPSTALEDWAKLETQRLGALRLARLDPELESLGRRLTEPPLSLLLHAALPGHAYGQALSVAGLATLQRGELRSWARRALAADRMALILVGDLKFQQVLPVLEASLGSLLPGEGGLRTDPAAEDPSAAPGRRRLEVTTQGQPLLLAGWRVPPATHPDRLALEALALAFGGEDGGPPGSSPLLRSLRTRTLVPGGRFSHLFVVEARPEEGRGVGEAEEAIKRMVRQTQEEPVSAETFEGIVRRLELASLATQSDTSRLVLSLGHAWCQTGDWRTAFPSFRMLRREGPAVLQKVARAYLTDANTTTVALQPDLPKFVEERGESELLRLLRARALRSVDDPIKAEILASKSMEQLLLMSREQREQFLRLLGGGTK